ncbi:flavin reductase family protein [Nocardia sp. NPDC005366]|uniref:flavin reductase family protein n=1 Tax=Nocardia sp. NPDC005366 TaxID=3156878 RepID=UPI0033A3A567
MPELDPALMRGVLGHFATGVVAITGIDPATAQPTGLAANSFTSVSLDPPLIAFCVAVTSTSWPRLRAAGHYVVNILSEDQERVCRQLAARGTDKFHGIEWNPSPSGAPVLVDCLAWIEAEPEAEHAAGDHTIVVSRIRHLHASGQSPLVFFRGQYGRVTTAPAGGPR